MPESQEKRDNLVSGIIVATVSTACGAATLSVYFGSLVFAEVQHERDGYATIAAFGIFRSLVILGVLTNVSDKMSNRSMLLISSAAATLSCFLIAGMYATDQSFGWKVIALASMGGSHALGLGPASWPYMAEVLGTDVRSKGVSLMVLISRFSIGVTMVMLPTAFDIIGTAGVYAVFGCMNVFGYFLLYHYVQDFQGLTLEEAHAADSSPKLSAGTLQK